MFLLGYDIGSSSVKASLVDAGTGKCVASAFFPKTEAGIIAVRSGWAEQEPEDWWENLKLSTQSVLSESGIAAGDIKAIGISYQMHGLVCVDRQQRVLRPAMVRFACGPLWTKGVRNNRRGVLPCALAQFSRQFYRF
jgi:xylulokinase